MNFFRDLTTTILVFILLCSTFPAHAQVDEVLWQKEIEAGGGRSYSPGAAFFDVTDNKLLIVGTSFLPNVFSEGQFKLWEIDMNGNMTMDRDIGDVRKKTIPNIQAASQIINGLSISKDRKINVAGGYHGHGKAVMSMSRQGEGIEIKSIIETSLIDDNDIVLKKIELPGDNSLLIGKNSRDDAFVIKVDPQGNKLWEQAYDQGKLEYFSDGVSVGDNGDFIVVGGIMNPTGPMSIEKNSAIWVLKCDSQGKILSNIVFSGNPFVKTMPQICQIFSGEIIVVYDNFHPNGVTLKAFTSDMIELWEKKAFKDETAAFSFKIKAIPERGFIVAFGIDSTGLAVHEFSETGDVISKNFWEKVVRGGNFLLEVSTDKAFVILQTRAIEQDRINRLKVIALKLTR